MSAASFCAFFSLLVSFLFSFAPLSATSAAASSPPLFSARFSATDIFFSLPSIALATTLPSPTVHVSLHSSLMNAWLCEMVRTPPWKSLSALVSAAKVSLSR